MAVYPVARSPREQEIAAAAGQLAFGPLNFILYDPEDLRVGRRPAADGGGYVDLDPLAYTVTIDSLTGYPTVTLDVAAAANDSYWFRSVRIDARKSDATLGGAVQSKPFETELQRFTRVNQELRRDIDRALSHGYENSPYDAQGFRIMNVGDAAADTDAITKKYADQNYGTDGTGFPMANDTEARAGTATDKVESPHAAYETISRAPYIARTGFEITYYMPLRNPEADTGLALSDAMAEQTERRQTNKPWDPIAFPPKGTPWWFDTHGDVPDQCQVEIVGYGDSTTWQSRVKNLYAIRTQRDFGMARVKTFRMRNITIDGGYDPKAPGQDGTVPPAGSGFSPANAFPYRPDPAGPGIWGFQVGIVLRAIEDDEEAWAKIEHCSIRNTVSLATWVSGFKGGGHIWDLRNRATCDTAVMYCKDFNVIGCQGKFGSDNFLSWTRGNIGGVVAHNRVISYRHLAFMAGIDFKLGTGPAAGGGNDRWAKLTGASYTAGSVLTMECGSGTFNYEHREGTFVLDLADDGVKLGVVQAMKLLSATTMQVIALSDIHAEVRNVQVYFWYEYHYGPSGGWSCHHNTGVAIAYGGWSGTHGPQNGLVESNYFAGDGFYLDREVYTPATIAKDGTTFNVESIAGFDYVAAPTDADNWVMMPALHEGERNIIARMSQAPAGNSIVCAGHPAAQTRFGLLYRVGERRQVFSATASGQYISAAHARYHEHVTYAHNSCVDATSGGISVGSTSGAARNILTLRNRILLENPKAAINQNRALASRETDEMRQSDIVHDGDAIDFTGAPGGGANFGVRAVLSGVTGTPPVISTALQASHPAVRNLAVKIPTNGVEASFVDTDGNEIAEQGNPELALSKNTRGTLTFSQLRADTETAAVFAAGVLRLTGALCNYAAVAGDTVTAIVAGDTGGVTGDTGAARPAISRGGRSLWRFRNSGAQPLKFVHATASLRCPGEVNYFLPKRAAVDISEPSPGIFQLVTPQSVLRTVGTAAPGAGVVTAVVNHNLPEAPAAQNIALQHGAANAGVTRMWVSGITATQFTINLDANTGGATVLWEAMLGV